MERLQRAAEFARRFPIALGTEEKTVPDTETSAWNVSEQHFQMCVVGRPNDPAVKSFPTVEEVTQRVGRVSR